MRRVLRYAQHRIIRHPEGQVNVAAPCQQRECCWQSSESSDVADVDRQCMAHTGLTGHDAFTRKFTDVALVLRVDE